MVGLECDHCSPYLACLSPMALAGKEQYLHIAKGDIKQPTIHIHTHMSIFHININLCLIQMLFFTYFTLSNVSFVLYDMCCLVAP